MPFDYGNYRQKCDGMTTEQLQKEWENYTRQMSAGATSTATSILFMPLTAGLSVVGVGLSAPRIHNARKKREIIEAGLQARGTTHKTRAGDVLAPMAVSGIIGGLTLGLAPPGFDSFAGVAAGRGLEIAATNTTLNATEAVVIDVARKKAANETDTQSPEQKERYGTMAVPFLIDESVLAFQQQDQLCQPLTPGSTMACPVEVPVTDPKMQMTPCQPPLAISDQALSSPTRDAANSDICDHDLSHLLTADEEHILAMHALALEMEKREAGKQHTDLANIQIQSQPPTQAQLGEIENQLQSLGIIQENLVHSDEAATPHLSNKLELQGHAPVLPPRRAPHSATTLPARFYSSQTVSYSSQDTSNSQFLPQPLPPYQSQYFPESGVVAEPQQYYPPPLPPKQRQDSGYNSMYSTPSIGSASSQTYAPPPSVFSRHSSMPQSYPPPPNAFSRHSSIPQPYPPPPTSFYPPQMQVHQGHRASESSLYPMTPPPPYDPPPHSPSIVSGPGKETDYFNQNAVPPSSSRHKNSSLPFNHLLEQSQTLVDGMNKGWQWARGSALPIKAPTDSKKIVEPDYGPPPPVPAEWRGS